MFSLFFFGLSEGLYLFRLVFIPSGTVYGVVGCCCDIKHTLAIFVSRSVHRTSFCVFLWIIVATSKAFRRGYYGVIDWKRKLEIFGVPLNVFFFLKISV